MIRLSRYDLPVLYKPATEMIAIGFGTCLRNYSPTGCMQYSNSNQTYFLDDRPEPGVMLFLDIRASEIQIYIKRFTKNVFDNILSIN
jgi:hypothetical protein